MQLEVSDTGPGIPLEIQTRLFEPYFATKSAGRGIGLAVVDGIVRSLNGEIRLVTESGKGTAFRILLPRYEGREAIPGPKLPAGEAVLPIPQSTILVVEDEDPLRQALAKMLRKSGFKVLEAENGSAAIDRIASGSKIDIILLDLTLPGPSA